ncbi:MAG: hypothetical protein RIC85_04250 [Gammaproteobacteria bacterium]
MGKRAPNTNEQKIEAQTIESVAALVRLLARSAARDWVRSQDAEARPSPPNCESDHHDQTNS